MPDVLLITYSADGAADLVAAALRRRGAAVHRLDTDRFPGELHLGLAQGVRGQGAFSLDDGKGRVDLAGIDAVWYRRVYGPSLPDTLEPRYARACRVEAQSFLTGLFAALRGARWVDPIPRVHRANHKLLQLRVAHRSGLEVPDTLMTNDPRAARRFFDAHDGGVVTKMLRSIEMYDNRLAFTFFTRSLREEDFEEIGGLEYCPMVFQEKVPKEVELRVTVVGERLFVAGIESTVDGVPTDDWRLGAEGHTTRLRRESLPPALEEALLGLMRAYGLSFGAIDLIRRPDGRHIFLEINAAGEWAWLEERLGLPIADALADLLAGGRSRPAAASPAP